MIITTLELSNIKLIYIYIYEKLNNDNYIYFGIFLTESIIYLTIKTIYNNFF